MLDRSPMGIRIVRFPLEVETRRAKVPLHDHVLGCLSWRSSVALCGGLTLSEWSSV